MKILRAKSGFARFVCAFLGSAVCLLVSITALSIADQWLKWRVFELPILPLDLPLEINFWTVGLPSIVLLTATSVLLAVSSIPQILLKRETFVGYLVLCGAPALFLIAFPAFDGVAIILAAAAMMTGTFWWFSYRRGRQYETGGSGSVTIAWTALLAGIIAVAAVPLLNTSNQQEALPASAQIVPEPALIGGAALGRHALMNDWRGRLFLYHLPSGQRRMLAKKGVVDVENAGDGSAWILSTSPSSKTFDYEAEAQPGTFTLSRYRDGRIVAESPVPYAADEHPAAIAVRNGAPILIGSKTAFIKDNGSSAWRKLPYDREIGRKIEGHDITTLVSGDGKTVFVGLDLGEWGGGLATLNLANGAVQYRDKRGPGLCDGPLNSDCDPITGIVADPNDDRCIFASIGLAHLSMHGRIIRVCPEAISVELERILERPGLAFEPKIRNALKGETAGYKDTEEFTALLQTRDGSILALSRFAAYRYEGTRWSRYPLPYRKRIGTLFLSEDSNGFILLSSWSTSLDSSVAYPVAVVVN